MKHDAKQNLLKKAVAQEVRKVLKEDYARGIPDFALSEIASEAAEGLKRHLRRYIQTSASDPVKQRQMLAAANQVLRDLEKVLKDKMEDKLQAFLRSV